MMSDLTTNLQEIASNAKAWPFAEAGALAWRVALLSPRYQAAAEARAPEGLNETFLAGLARGQLQGVTPPDSMARAIAPAFLRPLPPPEVTALLAEGRQGETLLLAIDRIAQGCAPALERFYPELMPKS